MPIGYAVEPERCLGCGSCAILAPGVFAVVRRVRLVRQPASEAEVTACAAAALVCPTQAIEAVTEGDEGPRPCIFQNSDEGVAVVPGCRMNWQ